MKRQLPLKSHTFSFNPSDNGGEQLTLTTHFIANGDSISNEKGVFLNQEISLQSYCNSTTLNLYGVQLTPEKLRELANQLEEARKSCVKD